MSELRDTDNCILIGYITWRKLTVEVGEFHNINFEFVLSNITATGITALNKAQSSIRGFEISLNERDMTLWDNEIVTFSGLVTQFNANYVNIQVTM